MSKHFLYIRGNRKAQQMTNLKAKFPAGEPVVDREAPEELERLISEAGDEDIIAADNIAAMPGISTETYIKLCKKGAGLCFLQQPYLNSSIFAAFLTSEQTQQTARAILQQQLDAEAARQKKQREKERAGMDAAAAAGRKAGRRGGEKRVTEYEIYMKTAIRAYMAQGMTGPQMLEAINSSGNGMTIHRNTLNKYRRALKAQAEEEEEKEGVFKGTHEQTNEK